MTPESELRVASWITALRAAAEGKSTVTDHAAQAIWERYFERLVRKVAGKLPPGGDSDGEDVALSVLASFCNGAAAGRFPHLDDPHNLWPLLAWMAGQKVADRIEKIRAIKRGGRMTNRGDAALEEAFGPEPSPELAAEMAELYRRRLESLPEDELDLRRIALWKMEGYTSHEIADRLGRSERTVATRLGLIRKRWLAAAGDER